MPTWTSNINESFRTLLFILSIIKLEITSKWKHFNLQHANGIGIFIFSHQLQKIKSFN